MSCFLYLMYTLKRIYIDFIFLMIFWNIFFSEFSSAIYSIIRIKILHNKILLPRNYLNCWHSFDFDLEHMQFTGYWTSHTWKQHTFEYILCIATVLIDSSFNLKNPPYQFYSWLNDWGHKSSFCVFAVNPPPSPHPTPNLLSQ